MSYEANVFFEGQEFYVEGDYIPSVPGKMYTANGDGWPDEPESFELTLAVRIDCNEDGTPSNLDVTSLYGGNHEFENECIETFKND